MTVLLVGDRASKTNSTPGVAFKGAKCYKRLQAWMAELGIDKPILANQAESSFKQHYERAIVYNIPIIALGVQADLACHHEAIRLSNEGFLPKKHFRLPHPSGLNRQLNDKAFEARQLLLCKEWLNERT